MKNDTLSLQSRVFRIWSLFHLFEVVQKISKKSWTIYIYLQVSRASIFILEKNI